MRWWNFSKMDFPFRMVFPSMFVYTVSTSSSDSSAFRPRHRIKTRNWIVPILIQNNKNKMTMENKKRKWWGVEEFIERRSWSVKTHHFRMIILLLLLLLLASIVLSAYYSTIQLLWCPAPWTEKDNVRKENLSLFHSLRTQPRQIVFPYIQWHNTASSSPVLLFSFSSQSVRCTLQWCGRFSSAENSLFSGVSFNLHTFFFIILAFCYGPCCLKSLPAFLLN